MAVSMNSTAPGLIVNVLCRTAFVAMPGTGRADLPLHLETLICRQRPVRERSRATAVERRREQRSPPLRRHREPRAIRREPSRQRPMPRQHAIERRKRLVDQRRRRRRSEFGFGFVERHTVDIARLVIERRMPSRHPPIDRHRQRPDLREQPRLPLVTRTTLAASFAIAQAISPDVRACARRKQLDQRYARCVRRRFQ